MRPLDIYFHMFLIPLALGLFTISSAGADPLQDPPPLTSQEVMSNAEHINMLRKGQYVELDREMNQIQRDYEEGRRDDINLSHLFRAFYDTDPALDVKYEAWIAAFPHSYAAYEAQGIYYRRYGYQIRGSNYAGKTAPQKFEEMQLYLNRAMDKHKHAMSLTAKPMLTYYNVLSIAKLSGSRPTAKKMMELAIQADPKNYIVRFKYMLMLETRWGGSLNEMKQFRAEAKRAGLPDKQLQYFDELISDEMKWLALQNRKP